MITNLRSRLALNPVTLKELRQMVRSRLVSSGLIAFLFLQVAVVSIALLTARSASSDPLGQSYGTVVFGTVTGMLGFMLLLGIPGFVSARMAAERSADRLDLQFTTALAPTQFIDGKIAAAAVLMLLFASTSLPFLMLAYLLRGVDVFTMLRSFGFLLVLALCVCHVVLLLGSIRLSKALRIIIVIGLVQVALPLGAALVGGMAVGGADLPLWGAALALLAAACGCALVRALAAAAISPPHANSARLVRRLAFAFWILWGAATLLATVFRREVGWILAWAFVFVVVADLLMLFAVSSKAGCSRRVLAEILRRPGARVWQFPFFTGAENGIVFCVLLGALSAAVFWLFTVFAAQASFPDKEDFDGMMAALTILLAYPMAYMLTARLIWQIFLRQVMNPRFVGVMAMLGAALFSVLPYLLTLGNYGGQSDAAMRFPGNLAGALIAVSDDDETIRLFHQLVSGAWALMVLAALGPSLLHAFRAFRPPESFASGSVPAPAAPKPPSAEPAATPALPAFQPIPEPPPLPPETPEEESQEPSAADTN
ncbi:MAG: hypothetical protein GX615_13640 [Lentisphaerae bacterium]|nr:hypothetical protein [Lentisphaerota bacterium]